MTTTQQRLDCAELWRSLAPDDQAAIGAAATLWLLAAAGAATAAERSDHRLQRFYDIAEGIATDALTATVDAVVAAAGDAATIPDLEPFGIAQCPQCGAIEELRCRAPACLWATLNAAAAA